MNYYMMAFVFATIAAVVVASSVTLIYELNETGGLCVVLSCMVGFFCVFSSPFAETRVNEQRDSNTFKMKYLFTIILTCLLTLIGVVLAFLSFILPDYTHILMYELKKNAEWLIAYACLFGAFYLFSSPFFKMTTKPSYAIFCMWYGAWFGVTVFYHFHNHWLPSIMGVDMRSSIGLFWTIYISSILLLLVFHILFIGLSRIGFVSHAAGKLPEFITIIYNCVVISAVCCIFYSRCGNYAGWRATFPISKYGESNDLVAKLTRMRGGLEDQICSSWFGPVGSPSDYPWPHLSKWVIYGKLHCNGSCLQTSDKISPVYSMWATIMCIYIANYVVARSQGWADTHPPVKKQKKQVKPNFKEMVPWYSGTSSDLYKMVVDLLVTATIFVGRFDMRMMQAVKSKVYEETQRDDFLFEHFSKDEDLWFDFVADTGDGGNSSYTVAHLLAQPKIKTKISNTFRVGDTHPMNDDEATSNMDKHTVDPTSMEDISLRRGKFLLIGGDLAYPNPSAFSYEKRFFRPFEYALQPPPFYKPVHIILNKPMVPTGESDIGKYKATPQCFVIPGNHDWFDGLQTFTRYICHRSWLGGWWMPQKRSYFALRLPKEWWVFGLDQALHEDIDDYQFKFFAELIKAEDIDKKGFVIVMTHEPNWLLDWYSNDVSGKNDESEIDDSDDDESRKNHKSGKNVSHLIRHHLKGRCKLRMAGDLHHYMHHTSVPSSSNNTSVPSDPNNISIPSSSDKTSVPSDKPVYVQHLLVNGCGGAFLHPTHTFRNFKNLYGTPYECKYHYPSFKESRKIAQRNIFNFRKRNLGFDIIGGVIYFILTFSMFPLVGHIFFDDWSSGPVKDFFNTTWSAFVYMLSHSYVSLAGTLLFLVIGICFVPSKVPWKKRVIIGILHVSAHIAAALTLMLLFELGVEIFIRHHLLTTSGYHTLYEWYRLEESKHFPDPADLRGRIERWTFGFYPACIKYIMFAFDVPEVMTITRAYICKKGLESLPREDVIFYYVSVFIFFWLFSTYMVSLVFGTYLYICVNWFNLHYDEAFSSLRTENFKAFTRFHINKDNGNLEVFTLAVDEVPKEWKLDPQWCDEERREKEREDVGAQQLRHEEESMMMSHSRTHPSMWTAANNLQNPLTTVRIVDHFVIERRDPPNLPNFEACSALGKSVSGATKKGVRKRGRMSEHNS